MNKIADIEKMHVKKDLANFEVGDTVKVNVKIKEGDKLRIQAFEGIVIAKKGPFERQTFCVRRLSYGEGVERVFQLHSPMLESISVVKRGSVKRSKLYYLRKKIGKSVKVEEKKGPVSEQNAEAGKEGNQ